MSSLFGTPFQMMNTMVEVLFILDHRLRDQVQRNFSLKKVCDEIFDRTASNFIHSSIVEDFYAPRRLFPLSDLQTMLQEFVHHPSLRIPPESFEKLFHMATMAVKLQILRCNRMTDISLVTENKLRELRDMVGTAALRDEITQVKANLSVFYSSLSVGELARLRTSLLNHFRKCNHPVGVLISDGYQAESGQLVVSTHGPNTAHLGAATVYNEEGAVMDEYVLPIAGKTVEALPPYGGENLFCSKKVERRLRLTAVPGATLSAAAAAAAAAATASHDGAGATMAPYHSDGDSMSEFGQLDAALEASDSESVSSSASYAVRLEATRTTAAHSPQTPRNSRGEVFLNY